jgi:hypothetical protein
MEVLRLDSEPWTGCHSTQGGRRNGERTLRCLPVATREGRGDPWQAGSSFGLDTTWAVVEAFVDMMPHGTDGVKNLPVHVQHDHSKSARAMPMPCAGGRVSVPRDLPD